jgi:hypothetical protein
MKAMVDAPRDRPFLARFIAPRGGDVKFCQFRPERYRNGLDLENPEIPRWDVGEALFYNDTVFVGWTDLPEGFETVNIRD